MSTFGTGVQDLISDSDGTNGVFNAMTPAMDSTQFKTVRCRLLSYGTGGLQVQPYVEYSDDGVNWAGADRDVLDSLITPTDGKMYTPGGWGSTDIYGGGFSPKPFVRFGLYAKSTSTADPRAFQAELEITSIEVIRPVTLVSDRQMVFSTGTTHKFAVTPVLDAAQYDEARASVEVESKAEVGGAFNYLISCKQVNHPKQPVDYTDLVDVPSSTYQAGTTVGTTFTTLPPGKRYIQFYAQVKRTGGSAGNLVIGRIRTRIDLRKL